jgi:hypothetical protein
MRPCPICGSHGGHHASCPAVIVERTGTVAAYCYGCDVVCELPAKLRPEWTQCPQCKSYLTSEIPEITPPNAETVEPVPEIDGEVVGFRQWAIDPQSWRLTGLGAGVNDAWEPGVNEAKCLGGYNGLTGEFDRKLRHRAPDEHCDCGFNVYAHPDPGWAAQRSVGGDWKAKERAVVAGALVAWGDEFYLHPGGFRAQYARPVLLAIPDDCPKPLRAAIVALADDYGCDTCEFAILEAAAREHGQLVPDAMLPEPAPTITTEFKVHWDPSTFREAARAFREAFKVREPGWITGIDPGV